MSSYDYLIVGAGLFGATFAHEAVSDGKRVLVIDRRGHIGGNCWSHNVGGVEVHDYGPHFIHTNDSSIWGWFDGLARLVPSVPSPVASWCGKLYSLPFSMITFNQLWGVTTPEEAKAAIESQRIPCAKPKNLEEHVLDMVGVDIYERLVKGYTEKQYGKPCSELPASLISRMPVLFEWSANYNGKVFQGVPVDGYGPMFEKLLDGVEVQLGVDYLGDAKALRRLAKNVIYTGGIDEYFGYRLGALEWRGRRFDERVENVEMSQTAALINYQDKSELRLRSMEHRLFIPPMIRRETLQTVITDEYAVPWEPGDEPYYTVNDKENQVRYSQYARLAEDETGVHFGGRLGEYRYYTMEDTVKSAWRLCEALLGTRDRFV